MIIVNKVNGKKIKDIKPNFPPYKNLYLDLLEDKEKLKPGISKLYQIPNVKQSDSKPNKVTKEKKKRKKHLVVPTKKSSDDKDDNQSEGGGTTIIFESDEDESVVASDVEEKPKKDTIIKPKKHKKSKKKIIDEEKKKETVLEGLVDSDEEKSDDESVKTLKKDEEKERGSESEDDDKSIASSKDSIFSDDDEEDNEEDKNDPYYGLTPEEREEKEREEYIWRFRILRKQYGKGNANIKISDYNEHSDLEDMKRTYDRTIRELYLDDTVDQYRMYLMMSWVAMEYVCTQYVGIDLAGFAIQQTKMMHKYDRMLIELGEKSYNRFGSNIPVEVRLLGTVIFQAAIFFLGKVVVESYGENIANLFKNFTGQPPDEDEDEDPDEFDTSAPQQKMRGPSMNPSDVK